MIAKQVTNDKDITSFYDRLNGATCAYSFIKKEAARLENLNLIYTLEKARELAPAFNSYLSLKEMELGKSRKLFTELEREAFTKEFMEINKLANSMLGFKGDNLSV